MPGPPVTMTFVLGKVESMVKKGWRDVTDDGGAAPRVSRVAVMLLAVMLLVVRLLTETAGA